MSEENKALVRRVFEEAWSQGRIEVIDEVTSPDFVDHDPQNPSRGTRGPDAIKPLVTMYRKAFPDLSLTIDAMYADGDQVITRWTATGTHTGELPGMPATGKRSTITGISIDCVEDGEITESWTNWDTLGMLQQLGIAPGAEAAATAAG
jgi:steroid delta-isomerase-like uncharacterized protein